MHFEKCIKSAADFLDGDDVEIMSTDFWKAGNTASGLNSGAIAKLAKKFADALADSSENDIQI